MTNNYKKDKRVIKYNIILMYIYICTLFLHLCFFDGDENSRGLFASHDADFGLGPSEEEIGIEGATTHAIVASPEGASENQSDFGNLGGANGVDQLGSVLGDAFMLVLLAYHEAGDVLQKEKRHSALAAEFHKVRALQSSLAEQHSVVRQNAHLLSVQFGEPAHQGLPVPLFKLEKLTVVHDPSD